MPDRAPQDVLMARRVAFIRGINVGGKAKVPMDELRTALANRGLRNVRTYIQSGNVVYDAPSNARRSRPALKSEAATIAETIEDLRGFAPVVIVLDASDLSRQLNVTPYRSADPAKAFLVFVDGDVATLGPLDRYATNHEECTVVDGVVHLFCPNGLGRSKLAEHLAGCKTVPTTTRNLRTITKILELAEAP